jgi:hypothetical protein
MEFMNYIKAWMEHKRPQDSIEGISTSLNRLFETRGNDKFDDSSALPDTFMGEFAPFQDNLVL